MSRCYGRGLLNLELVGPLGGKKKPPSKKKDKLRFRDLTRREWEAIKRMQKNRCALCDRKRKLERDHIYPHSKGGSSFAYNIQGLCRPCNLIKLDRLIDSPY